jgi:hypothetical protein
LLKIFFSRWPALVFDAYHSKKYDSRDRGHRFKVCVRQNFGYR